MKNRLAKHLDALILSVLLLVLYASLYGSVSWLESVASVLLAFVVPGWLFVRLLFGERPFELEVEVILILFISAFLISLEVLVLIYFRIPITKTLLQWMVVVTDCLLLVILKIRRAAQPRQEGAVQRINWPSLLAAVIVPLVLLAFGLFHIHETRESFTEFYIIFGGSEEEPISLMVESHEERNQFFSLVCSAQEDEHLILGNFELSPGEQQQIIIAHSHKTKQDGKLRLALDQHKGAAGYRWVEIPGGRCEDLSAVFE